MSDRFTRRKFLKSTAVAGAGLLAAYQTEAARVIGTVPPGGYVVIPL
ncbi:MAG: twin-arginine translocation signal domain-containing protein [Verrucomicrobia bacterium]|nr:twin-arginine translocation signal domain-containing protein [Verrucomicrobiota bacterium]